MSASSLAEGIAQENAQPKRKKERRPMNQSLRMALLFWLFVGPTVLGLLAFVYLPIIWSILLSFFEARGVVTPTHFVGLQNYATLFEDPQFAKSLITVIVFALFMVPITFFASLGLALLVNSVRFGRGFFRSVFFIPTACSYVVASLIWKMSIFSGLSTGIANMLLDFFHQAPISGWLSSANPPWFWLVLVSLRLWLQAGFFMILFIAGLQEIPRELYEAAAVDGTKKGWTTFRYITFPLLRNTSVAVLLLNLIWAFMAFDDFFNLLNSFDGSSGNALLAQPTLVYLYQQALSDQNYGIASAGAIILALIIVVFTLIQGKLVGFGREQ